MPKRKLLEQEPSSENVFADLGLDPAPNVTNCPLDEIDAPASDV